MEQVSDSTSTTCSSPKNENFIEILKHDQVRYQKKGYGLISASLIAFSFLYYFPIVFKSILPGLEKKFSHNELFVILGMLSHTGIFILNNTAFYFIYVNKWPFFERYRILPMKWPWESNPEKWNKMIRKTILMMVFLHLVVTPILMWNEIRAGIKFRFGVEEFPSYKEIIGQIVFFMLCEDFLFYWIHRTLHHPRLYPYIHKKHHEYNITVSIAAEYAHPLEFVLGNVLPTIAGMKILGSQVHIVTYVMWNIIRITETLDGHCGYELSWSPFRLLPFSGSSSYHNYHHYQNSGNYCSLFTFWDSLCGTNLSYFKFLDKRRKKDASEGLKETSPVDADKDKKEK